MKWMLIMMVVLVAAGCMGSSGEVSGDDDNDSALFSDDDTSADDDTVSDDDTSVDDDTVSDDDSGEPNCAIVWLECVYENPEDADSTDECGVDVARPDNPADPNWAPYFAQWTCYHNILLIRNQAVLNCGSEAGCTDDWNFRYWECNIEFEEAMIDCMADPVSWDMFEACKEMVYGMYICGNI